jgi:hypothetical protein
MDAAGMGQDEEQRYQDSDSDYNPSSEMFAVCV